MLEEALAYASQGFHVFPILPGQKRPLTQHGFKEATTDPDIIRALWTATPDANIGWYPHPSGHCVVDLDRDHDELELPPTRVHETPSGGEHHIFLGELPGSQSKLGAHIDTRGADSYILLPPSVIDERDEKAAKDPSRCGTYKVKLAHPLAYVPWEFSERLTKVKPKPRDTEKSIEEIDTPERIEWMRWLAAAADPAIEGEGSNDATVELANRLLDWCTHEHVLDAMSELWVPRCQGEWTHEWLLEKVESIKQGCGRDSAIGCAEFEQPGFTPKDNEDTTAKANRRSRFQGLWPDEYVDMPEPMFWDPDTKMIPRVDGEGSTVLVYGRYGSHKTNVTLTWIMDMVAAGAKVCYAAGEGARGIGKHRIPAHCAARGVEVKDLRAWPTYPWSGKLLIVPAIPLLQDGTDVAEFIEAVKEFAPQVVVLDTLATATAGMDENSSQFSALLTDNGSIGRIKREFKATVIIVAHEGKDGARGARGHSGLSGNVDAGLKISADGFRIDVLVDKMRDGEAKGHTYYAVEPGTVPVPRRITEAEYNGLSPKAEVEDDSVLLGEVKHALMVLGAHEGGSKHMGVMVGELASMLLQGRGEEPNKTNVDGLRKVLDSLATRNPVYRTGGGGRGHPWVWGVPKGEK